MSEIDGLHIGDDIKKWSQLILQMNTMGDTGYFMEISLAYPDELHLAHDDYPLAPESFEILPHMLSKQPKP